MIIQVYYATKPQTTAMYLFNPERVIGINQFRADVDVRKFVIREGNDISAVPGKKIHVSTEKEVSDWNSKRCTLGVLYNKANFKQLVLAKTKDSKGVKSIKYHAKLDRKPIEDTPLPAGKCFITPVAGKAMITMQVKGKKTSGRKKEFVTGWKANKAGFESLEYVSHRARFSMEK